MVKNFLDDDRPIFMKVPSKIQPQVLRYLFKKGDDVRDAGLTTPDGIERIDDISYGSHPQQVMDIYYPKGTEGTLPTIVSIHGGGYVYGDKERYQYYCMNLAQRGFTVLNYTYRLAPETKYPGQLEDTCSAVGYALNHAIAFHIDRENMFFVGDSAGAQMLSQFAACAADPDYAAQVGLSIPDMRIGAIALNCGRYEFDDGDSLNKSYLTKPLEEYGDELDVLSHITEQYPPVFIMSALGDFLLSNAEPMHRFLDGLGVENELHIYGTEEKPLDHVFHVNIRLEEAATCNDEECEFFRHHVIVAEQ